MEIHIEIHRKLCMMLAIAASWTFACVGETCTDEELRHDVLEFLTTRYCGSSRARRVLTNEIRFDGDTNRLASVLTEFAVTNNERIAARSVRQLGKYGTCAQLPFLHSCVTNPALGKIAVEAVLRIEGVTSNSLEIVHEYLFQTNQFPFANIGDRTYLCHDLVGKVFSDSSLNGYRSRVLEMALDFETNVNIAPNLVDMAIVSADPGYRHSKRRLAVLRAAKQRLDYDAQLIVPSNYEVERRIDVYNFQTNYLINAINELVAYPEANLPD